MQELKNYIDGEWVSSETDQFLDVINPATEEVIGKVPMSTSEEVLSAIDSARSAFKDWRQTPVVERVQYLYKLKELMEDNFEELAEIITREEGKILESARGEIRRTIENVEVATGMPSLMMGYNSEDVARGIDEVCTRQPLGVFACIAPFNFPAMVPFWYIPYAIATGNTFIVKPSEKVPFSQSRLVDFLDQVGLPDGVINLINGGQRVSEKLIEHDRVEGISFVGSTGIARRIYKKAAENGKRVQAQGGACNYIVVMPDARLEESVENIISSFFVCAGQRCLAGQNLIAVGDIYQQLKDRVLAAASQIKVGNGMQEDVDMGPVNSQQHKESIIEAIDKAEENGAELLLDGRTEVDVEGNRGYFLGPTVIGGDIADLDIVQEEIFGPVLNLIKVDSFEEAVELINNNKYGNAGSIFTQSGKWARRFKYKVDIGNIGVNVGVAAPMPFFPFSGYKDSFFGDLHAQGKDVINFFTERKVVIERWF